MKSLKEVVANGVGGGLLELLVNSLKDKKQFVTSDGKSSKTLVVYCVPFSEHCF